MVIEWRICFLQTDNLYVPAADEGGKPSPAVMDAIAVKLQEEAAKSLI